MANKIIIIGKVAHIHDLGWTPDEECGTRRNMVSDGCHRRRGRGGGGGVSEGGGGVGKGRRRDQAVYETLWTFTSDVCFRLLTHTVT